MQASTFISYRESSSRGYAEDNVAAKRWLEADALEQARENFDSLLPEGLATPDNYLYEIQATTDEAQPNIHVGYLWFAVVTKSGVRTGYVYDLEVFPEFRRRGHAERAFESLEPIARELGLISIALHVFAHNPAAQSLYAKLGYQLTSYNMTKLLP